MNTPILGETFYWNRNERLSNDRDFNRTYNWSASQNGNGKRPVSDRDDYFTADALGSAWTTLDADNDGGTGSASTTASGFADKLTLTGRGSDIYGATNHFYSVYRKDELGNFDVSVKIDSLSNTDTWTRAGIIVADTLSSLGNGGYVLLCQTRGNGIQFNSDAAGNVGELEATPGTAANTTYPVWLRLVKVGLVFGAYYKTSESAGWTEVAFSTTPLNGNLQSQVGLFVTSRNAGSTATAVFDDFQGGGKISQTDYDLVMDGNAGGGDAEAHVSADVTAATFTTANYWGQFYWGGNNGLFATYYDNVDFTGTSVARIDTTVNIDWGAGNPSGLSAADDWSGQLEGYIVSDYSETYTFYGNVDDRFRLFVNGTKLFEKWDGCVCSEQAMGSIALTAGVRYPITIQFREDGGGAKMILKWQSASQARVVIPKRSLFAGHITTTGATTLTDAPMNAEDGWIEFAGSGTQVFTPKVGGTLHPNVLHSGTGTLQFATNALTTMGFFQSGGIWDLNGINLTTQASGTNRGDFQIWNGTSTSVTNLGGRTLTIAGHASFAGTPGNELGINPGSTWNMAVSGYLTAHDANIRYSNLTSAAGFATRSTNVSNNTNWNIYGKTHYWHRNDVLTSSTDANKAHNWTYNQDGSGWRPPSTLDDYFEGRTLGSAWIFHDTDGQVHTGTYDESGGQLRISNQGGDIWGTTNQFAVAYRTDLTGDWDVTLKVVDVSPNTGYGKYGLMAADNMRDLTQGGYGYLIAYRDGGTNLYSVKLGRAATTSEQMSSDVTSAATNLSLPLWLRYVKIGTTFHGYYKTTMAAGWTSVGSSTPVNGAANSHIGIVACAGDAATTKAAYFDDFVAGQNISNTDLDLSYNGSGSNADANSTLSAALAAASIAMTGYTGTFGFGSSTLTLNSGNINFDAGETVSAGSGTLAFTAGSGTQVFSPKSGGTFPAITKSGAGTLQISTNGLTTPSIAITGGAWDWGLSTLTHNIGTLSTSGAGTMTWAANTVNITTGNGNFSGLTSNTTNGSSNLAFTGTTGTQVFTPRSGSTHPHFTKSGAGTLQLSSNDLTCRSFTMTAGILDFNGEELTVNNNGNLSITNGTTTTFSNLGGRTITVPGTASFAGQNGNLLNMNPGTGWTITSTGALTASYATVGNSNATVSTGVPTNSTSGGGNTNWNFASADYSAWLYNSKISFNTTSSGANVAGNVSEFPLVVRLNSENFLFTQAYFDGRDIRFQDPDGTGLSFNVERWDAAGKVAEVWVKVPQVDGNSDRDYITMFWGNNSAGYAGSATGTFGNYKAVYHLAESPGASAPQFKDSSGTGNHGTAQGGATGDSVTAVIGKGFKLNGTSKYITTTTQFADPETFTNSCWFRTTSGSGGLIMGFEQGQTGQAGSHDRKIYMADDGKIRFGVYQGGHHYVTTTASYNDGAWHHAAYRMDGNGMAMYIDGILIGTAANTAAENTTGYWRAGYGSMGGWNSDPTSDWLNGTLDEVTFAHTSFSADYINLTYQTQKPGSKVATLVGTGLSNWPYSTKVYINTTASGANITSTQSNYPLLVRLTAANFNFAQGGTTGNALRFADSAGALLPYEIERWDATSKAADIWVLVPTVYGNNASQYIRMYWGHATASSLSSGAAVFLNSAGYAGVWHLSEDGGGTYRDASNADNHGTGVNLTNASDVTGLIGIGSNFTSSSNQGITVAHAASLHPSANVVTVEAWANATSLATYKRVLGKPFTSAATPYNQYDMEIDGSGTKMAFSLTLNGTEAAYVTTTNVGTATWNYFAGTYDGTTQKVYANGVMEGSGARAGTINAYGQPLSIGKYYHDNGSNWDGKLDEVRVSTVARSADWLKLCYENQKAGATMVTVGQNTPDYAKSLQFNFNTAGVGVAGNVTNIPILIRLTSSNFDFSLVRNDAADIRFIDKTGAALYHETVEWDKANKVGKVWVKVPQVDGNTTTDFITAYYGCSSCTANPWEVKDSVWVGYNAVYHLNGQEERPLDATPNANHGIYSHVLATSAGVTEPMGPYFNGTTNQVSVANNASLDGNATTWSFWIKTSDVGNSATWFSSKWILDRDFSGTNDDWAVVLNNTNSKLRFSTRNNVLDGNVNVGGGAWHMVHIVKSSTDKFIYVDGAQDVTVANADLLSNDEVLYVMGQDGSGNWTSGQLNDLWMYPSNRSADFIKLSYENQKESSTLLSTPVTTASFKASKIYRFNTTASGANVAGDVYDFPLLIRIADATIIDSTNMTGSIPKDLRFLDGDGTTWLPYQVERWDQGGNLAEVWVKVPEIDGNSSGDFITMYWNDVTNGSVPDASCGSCVFTPSNGFSGVWHLNEDGNNTGSGYADATGNGYHGTGTNMDAADDVASVVGLGSDFNSAADVEQIAAGTTAGSSASHTVSFWMYPNAAAQYAPVDKNPNDASAVGWTFKTRNDNAIWYRLGSESASTDLTKASAYTAGQWVHVTGTFDLASTTARLYINGTLGTTNAAIPRRVNNTGTTLRFGQPSVAVTGEKLVGKLDEIQISSVARDSNWVKLTYETQRTSPTLFNPSQNAFLASRKYTFNTTKTGANIMADVDNFPMLLRITGSTIVQAIRNDTSDIRFLDGDGKTWLNYQVERWSKSVDSAEVWVLVPKVDGNSDRDFITLYYNDSTDGSVPKGECASCVFSTTNNFQGVWHLNNSVLTDATANANNGSNTGSTDGAGVSGSGRNFDGTDDFISFGNGNSLKNISSAITVEAWVRSTLAGAASNYSVIRHDGHFTALQYGSIGAPAWSATWAPSLGYPATWTWNGVWNDDAWHHFTVQYQSGSYMVWKDGALYASSSSVTGSLNTGATTPFTIGATDGSGEDWTGRLDEVRVSSSFRDSNYIKLSYETQRRSGNLFWNSRPGPNNKTVLTATDAGTYINLAWTTPVTDSANADSVGIWVKYSGRPDSVGATGQTKVAILPKTDSAYAYPATYGMTYYFGLAVRNSSGAWSPFTAVSTDTVKFGGGANLPDTIYVDSAIGTTSGGTAASCTDARNPTTPLKEIEDAVWCAQASGFTPNDTLVIRVMPGLYTSTFDNDFAPPSTYPVVVTSFDDKSRGVVNSTERSSGVRLGTYMTLRRMDIRAATNNTSGIRLFASADSVVMDGVRIYNNGATVIDTGIIVPDNGCEGVLVANTIIDNAQKMGLYVNSDDRGNFIGNTVVGIGAASSYGFYYPRSANGTYMTVTNNIFYNWDYGIYTTDSDNNIGTVINNMFHQVTSANEVVGEDNSASVKVSRDPMFFTTNIRDRNAYKLLPGSPAIDAGTSTISTGASQAWSRVSFMDHWGIVRPTGSARDIGAYEGRGYTPNPSGEFDTLTNTVSGNTVIVKNGKWKLVWDMARGGGITGFYDMTVDSNANLVGTGSLLFDVKLDAYVASSAPTNNLAPDFSQRTRTRAVVRQRVAFSATMDLTVYYAVYASGHIYVQSEISNLSAGTLANMAVGYSTKLGSASAATRSGGAATGDNVQNGWAFLNTGTRDVLLGVTQDLDLGAAGVAEVWSQTGSIAGSLDSVWMGTADMADLTQAMKRQHHFLLYVGDGSLDIGKVATLTGDAYSPSPVAMSAGSLNHERSWQGQITGHWTFDDGAGSTAKDKSILNTNDATITSGAWTAGKAKGALRLTTSTVASVADNAILEADQYKTVMVWVKPDFSAMNSDAYVLSKGLGTSDGWHFRRVTSDSKIKFTMANVVLTSPTLTTGAWSHLAAVVDGSRYVKLYVNGVLVAASSVAATATANANAMRIGENGGTNGVDRFAGDIDDVRIYSTSISVDDIQSIYRLGFSEQYGHYFLRADNNNRVVALLNEGAAATRVQPAFRIDNWYGTKSPKYVYLNGIRLVPNTDYVVDSIAPEPAFGSQLVVQLNEILTGSDQTLFIDDNDSTGYLGTSGMMKALTISSTANDKISIQNFSGSNFGAFTSGQWALELDLNGWTDSTINRVTDSGFGEFNSWKAAAVSPNVALSSAQQLVGKHAQAGQSLISMKFRTTTSNLYSAGLGFTGSPNITYTLVDSSATRLSLIMDTVASAASGAHIDVIKRWTVYPTGRIIGSFQVLNTNIAMGDLQIRLNQKYDNNLPTSVWAGATALTNARWGSMGGGPLFHSAAFGFLSVRSNGAIKNAATQAALIMGNTNALVDNAGGADQNLRQLKAADSLSESTDDPITYTFVTDISKDYADSATADSLIKDVQTPATLAALGAGTINPVDGLDFNPTPDGFAEGDGAYVYTSGSGVAHFKFMNTVTHFNPVFRIKSWSFSTLPEFVIVNNQTLSRDYQYNAHVNFATSELIIQFNKTFSPGTHQFYIAHKTGLAVTLDSFEAISGEGVDSLKWTTQSEFENLGYHIWRRVAPVQDLPDSLAATGTAAAGAGIANALLAAAREEAAVAAMAKAAADSGSDSLPEFRHSVEQLKALGYMRINARIIPGAKGGSSASTSNYLFVDRTAAFETTYEYLLESADFAGMHVQYGPRKARPGNSLETALHSNYPNPFNPVTTLRFSLREKAKVSLIIYDAKGRMVRTLITPKKAMAAGKYRLVWNARDDRGFEVPSGQYFYRFTAPKYAKTRKMILVK